MERDQDESGTSGAASAYTNAEVFMLAFDIKGLKEQYKGDNTDQKDTIDRVYGGMGKGTEGKGKFRSEYGGSWDTEG